MALAAEQEPVAGVQRYRFTVDEFARMGEAGIFTEDDRVELIDGEVVEMTPTGAPHDPAGRCRRRGPETSWRPRRAGRERTLSERTLSGESRMRVSEPSVTTLLALALLLAPAGAAGQTADVPRTPWGVPDLNGVWDFRTLTPLERPEEYGDREFLTEEEVRTLEQGAVEQNEAADRAPAQRTEAGGAIGAYNRFWMDFGTEVVETRRTSLIVDPPNGRRPPRTDEGRTRFSAPGSFGSAPLEQIEDLSYFDRCLGTTGLPIFPVAYNNNVQLFQTEHHLVMLIEMLNTTRIIPLTDRPHGEIRQWLGDSRGRWEGDTLVVETTSFDRWLPLVGASREAHLVERFTRVGPGVIEYEYTIEDPTIWTAPWTAVQTLRQNPLPIYENACHEGNYAAANMLAGARRDEAAAAAGR